MEVVENSMQNLISLRMGSPSEEEEKKFYISYIFIFILQGISKK